jgi:hypothetical protein
MLSFVVDRVAYRTILALLAATILTQMGFVPMSAHAQVPTPTPFPPNSILSGKLLSGQYLSANEQLVSPNGKTRLIMQYDGNLCMYRVDNGQFLWESGLHGADKVHLQEDGDLVMQVDYHDGFEITWHTDTGGNPGAILVLRDDGNLVIVDTKGTVLWASNTAWNTAAPAATPAPAPTLVPTPAPTATTAPVGPARLNANQLLSVNQQLVSSNGKARLVMQSDGNLVLYRVADNRALWASGTYGKPMTQALMQTDGNFVGYNAGKTIAYWSSGTSGYPGASVVLGDDGDLKVVHPSGAVLWWSGTYIN